MNLQSRVNFLQYCRLNFNGNDRIHGDWIEWIFNSKDLRIERFHGNLRLKRFIQFFLCKIFLFLKHFFPQFRFFFIFPLDSSLFTRFLVLFLTIEQKTRPIILTPAIILFIHEFFEKPLSFVFLSISDLILFISPFIYVLHHHRNSTRVKLDFPLHFQYQPDIVRN